MFRQLALLPSSGKSTLLGPIEGVKSQSLDKLELDKLLRPRIVATSRRVFFKLFVAMDPVTTFLDSADPLLFEPSGMDPLQKLSCTLIERDIN